MEDRPISFPRSKATGKLMQNLSWSAQHTPFIPFSWSNFTQDKSHLKQDWLQSDQVAQGLVQVNFDYFQGCRLQHLSEPRSILCSLWFFSFYPGGLPLATRSPALVLVLSPCLALHFPAATLHTDSRYQAHLDQWGVCSNRQLWARTQRWHHSWDHATTQVLTTQRALSLPAPWHLILLPKTSLLRSTQHWKNSWGVVQSRGWNC